MAKPRLIVTPGEPAGIGPDLVLKLAQKAWPLELVICADKSLLAERAAQSGLQLTFNDYHVDDDTPPVKGQLTVLHVPLATAVKPGIPNPINSHYVLKTLHCAAQGCLSGEFAAVVTGPVQKSVINQAGIPFSGHTEYFAEQAGVERVVMMLATTQLRVALVTTHLPLNQVSSAITTDHLQHIIQILHHDLQTKFAIAQPRILVCGLNPHAGENGYLGREEIDTIQPVLQHLRQQGMDLIGPLPADTLFQPKYLQQADAVLAMYHDQGLPVLKYQGFGQAVNITLGLPFIRTSVDHGTALELAGTDKASPDSFYTAIQLAITMIKKSHE